MKFGSLCGSVILYVAAEMANNTNSSQRSEPSTYTAPRNERLSDHRKEKKKKYNHLKNLNVEVTFNPPTFQELCAEENEPTKVLNYSENDFPVLGTNPKKHSRNRNETGHLEHEGNTDSLSNSHPRRIKKMPKKILKSNKHKESFEINFEEIFLNISNKSSPKRKIRPVKHFKENIHLSGNPLDSDNPIRKKGVVSTKPKLKRLSCTKAMVYKAREEMLRLKAISQHIAVKNGEIFTNSDALPDELWKPLCLFKAKEIKECLIKSQNSIESEKDGEKVELFSAKINKNEVNDNFTTEEKCESDHSVDTESSEQSVQRNCIIPLEKVLQDSEIPPYKLLIHNNNFKRYCDNCVTSELNNAAEKLVNQLVRYQYKKYQIDPVKAAAKKRYVLGLRQVKKYVKMNKIKLIILVPNMEESLCDTIEELKSLATAYCIPYLFAFTRKKLGKIAYKKIGVSCFGILDYSGAEDNFKNCISILTQNKKMYLDKCSAARSHYELCIPEETLSTNQKSIEQDVNEEIEKNFMLKLSLKDNDDVSNDVSE